LEPEQSVKRLALIHPDESGGERLALQDLLNLVRQLRPAPATNLVLAELGDEAGDVVRLDDDRIDLLVEITTEQLTDPASLQFELDESDDLVLAVVLHPDVELRHRHLEPPRGPIHDDVLLVNIRSRPDPLQHAPHLLSTLALDPLHVHLQKRDAVDNITERGKKVKGEESRL